jgi:hypothetical protein
MSKLNQFQVIYVKLKNLHGVFDLTWGNRIIRLIVLSQIELAERNAFWLLFSGKAQEFAYNELSLHNIIG